MSPAGVARVSLRVAVAQPLTVALDVAANAQQHAAAVRAAGARVVVFPELSLTGYEFGAAPVAPDDDRLLPLVHACGATGSLALVGAPVAGEAGVRHIGMLAVDGGAARVVYRKQWLGGAEAACFTPGTSPAVLEVDGWRLGLAICRDTRFPEHAAATAALGIDAYVAGVLEHAADWAVPEGRARRVVADHRVWVAIASFAGSTGEGYAHAAGGSGIWAPDGRAVVRAGPEPGVVVAADLAL